ncbi:hypothetical protein HDU67_008003 [Dinochytrium kinnereticum]|nr:hypothetical protein HDU67_008003 [Dinochytrium kinnereticum]
MTIIITITITTLMSAQDGYKEHFSKEEFGDAKIRLYDRMVEDSHDHLFCSVRPLQYFVGDVLHRERNPRKVTWDELFLDLIFISTISRSEAYIKGVGSLTINDVNRFALVFTPVWQHWLLIHTHSNRFATYDIYFKIYTWIQMMLTAGMGINIENVGYVYTFTCKCKDRIYWTAPEFSFSVTVFIGVSSVGSIFYLSSLFSPSSYTPILWWSAFLAEQFVQNFLILFMRKLALPKWTRFRVAFNIEHHIERFGFFTIIMLGEVVVNILFDSYTSNFSWAYVTTAAGLLVAISLQWIYYNVDGSHQYTHALRLSVPTALLWTSLHYPFHLATVIGGAALSKIISLTLTKEIGGTADGTPWAFLDPGLRWAFLGGLSASLIFLSLIGLTHKSYEPSTKKKPRLPKKYRIAVRVLVALIIAPVLAVWGRELRATGVVVLASMLCISLTVLDEWGRLVVGKPEKRERRKRRREAKDDVKEVKEDANMKESETERVSREVTKTIEEKKDEETKAVTVVE